MRKITAPLLGALLLLGANPLEPTSAGAAAPETCPGAGGPPTEVFTGTFDESLEGAYVMVPFEVPEGTTRVRVKLCYDQPDSPTSAEIKHTLDLGIYDASTDGFHDENEFRGWGGSSRPNVLVTPREATLGFIPGAIPPGEWAAEIGVAAVAGQAEGDLDGAVAWRLEMILGSDPADLADPWEPAPYDETPARAEAGWYKGDLHVHARHSNPNDATMEEAFDYAFGEWPGGAGLDFITLSDYVTSRHWGEIGRFQHGYPGKLIARSAEVITYRGHINNHASVTYVDHRTGPIHYLRDGTLTETRPAEGAKRILGDIRAAGGFTQVNHPTAFPASVPGFGNICRGCSWEYSDEETDWNLVDAFEVQTGPAGTVEPKDHELGPNPFAPLAIEWWDRLQADGYRITAVGVSDSHHAGQHNGSTQSPIGQATTVVYAPELSEAGIASGIRAGHAYVKFFSAAGPDLRFTAEAIDAPGKGGGKGRPKAIMGDSLKVGENGATFTARVLGGGPRPEPLTLLVIKDGGPFLVHAVAADEATFEFSATEPGDYRLQLQRGTAIEALTNPITLVAR